MELGNYPSAVKAFERALEMSREMKLNLEQGQALHNLGHVYHKMKENKKSRSYYEQALVFANHSNDKAWAAWIETNINKLDEDIKSKETLEAGLLKSLAQYEETGDRIAMANSHHQFVGLLRPASRLRKSIQSFENCQHPG